MSTLSLPALHSTTALGQTQVWSIEVRPDPNSTDAGLIIMRYGKLNGKMIENIKVISVAKSQETPLKQAEFEAKAQWLLKQKKNGYVLAQSAPISSTTSSSSSTSSAVSSTVSTSSTTATSSIHESFRPMLAHKFTERSQHIKYPADSQFKLDGVRSGSYVSGSQIIMRSRAGNVFPFFNDIKQQITEILATHPTFPQDAIFDGELYSFEIPLFQTLSGYCNRKKLDGKHGWNAIPQAEKDSIGFYIFDFYAPSQPKLKWSQRRDLLRQIFSVPTQRELIFSTGMHPQTQDKVYFVGVKTLTQPTEVKTHHDEAIALGYEGLMIRNLDGLYVIKNRTNNLLKYKEFEDAEFEIANATCSGEDSATQAGCIIWHLKVPGLSELFACVPTKSSVVARRADYAEYLANPQKFIGQKYTVRYQELYENGTPRFPKGIGIRYDL
jgi:ATP-dependent DNA ligase